MLSVIMATEPDKHISQKYLPSQYSLSIIICSEGGLVSV